MQALGSGNNADKKSKQRGAARPPVLCTRTRVPSCSWKCWRCLLLDNRCRSTLYCSCSSLRHTSIETERVRCAMGDGRESERAYWTCTYLVAPSLSCECATPGTTTCFVFRSPRPLPDASTNPGSQWHHTSRSAFILASYRFPTIIRFAKEWLCLYNNF